MSLRIRLLGTFALVTAVMLVPSLFAVSRLAQLRDIAVDGRSGHAAAVSRLGRMQALSTDLDRLERSYVATGDPALGTMASERAAALRGVFREFEASPYGELGSDLGGVIDELVARTGMVDRLVRDRRFAEATEGFEALLPQFGLAREQYRMVADSIDAAAEADLAREK